MKKEYVLNYNGEHFGICQVGEFYFNTFVKDNHVKGNFKRDKAIKGWRNGHEIGIFTTENNIKYVVFSDYSICLFDESVTDKQAENCKNRYFESKKIEKEEQVKANENKKDSSRFVITKENGNVTILDKVTGKETKTSSYLVSLREVKQTLETLFNTECYMVGFE